MKILLLGAAGQLGRHLALVLPEYGQLVTSARRPGPGIDRPCDLARRPTLEAQLDEIAPEVVINAAAWTDVDGAESRREEALVMNRDVPGVLARWCARSGARLIHYSTDYVFDGRRREPLKETMETCPVNEYGASKRAGEEAILASGAGALILRTSWVFSVLPGNFFSAVFRRAREGQPLSVVDDQMGNPTWAGALARATGRCLERFPQSQGPGLYHVSCRDAMSWFEFARVAMQAAVDAGHLDQVPEIRSIASSQWPQAAARPAWSVLDCSRFESGFDFEMPDVARSLDECMATWSQYQC